MTLALDSVRLAQRNAGDAGDAGDATVLVLPSLGLGVADLWGPVADLVGDRVTVIGVELPGHGLSATTQGPLSIEELADAALAAIPSSEASSEATTAPPYVVAGVSIGGLIAQAAAHRHPEIVRGLLLCNTLPRISTAEDWRGRAETVRAHGLASQVDGALARWWGSGIRARRPETVRQLSERLASRDQDSYLSLYEALATFDGSASVATLGLPAHLVAGDEDGPTPQAAMREMAASLPDARFEVLEGDGHQAPLEAPERVAAALLEVVERAIGG